MNKIQAKLLIRFQSDEVNCYLKFSLDWNFNIGSFYFSFVDKDYIQVSFEFEANLIEEEDGQIIHIIPSEQSPEFQKKREELEQILDLLSLSTGHAIKIKTGSATISSQGIGASNPVENTKVVDLPDVEGVTKRFADIQKRNDEGLLNGLRAYRMSLAYEEPGEKIAKLWVVIEQLYSKSGGRMFSDEELKKLKELLESWEVSHEYKREVVLKRIKDTPEISPMGSMVEKVKLMDEKGHFTAEEVRKILNEWRSARNSTAHGARGANPEEVDDVLWNIEETVEVLIGSQVYPKMIRYLLFQESDIKKDFLERQGFLVSKLRNGYCAYAIKYDEFDLCNRFLPHELTSNEASVYVISHNEVHKFTSKDTHLITLSEIENPLQELVSKLQRRINEDTE